MKRKDKLSLSKSNAQLSLILFLAIALSLSFLLFIFVGIARGNITPSLSDEWILIVGTTLASSILASSVFFSIYSRVAQLHVLNSISETMIQYSEDLFRERFDRMLPIKVLPSTDLLKEEFDKYFYENFEESRIYYFRGVEGSFASFRLGHLIKPDLIREKQIRFLLLNPNQRVLFHFRAVLELTSKDAISPSEEDIKKEVDNMLLKLYVSVYVLYQLSKLYSIELAFYDELASFRSEIMDDGNFLTYYLGGKFPATSIYSKNTEQYKAHFINFNQNYKLALNQHCDEKPRWVVLNNIETDNEFIALLKNLGCTYSLETLKKECKLRTDRYKELVKESNLSTAELFHDNLINKAKKVLHLENGAPHNIKEST